ncbi:Transcriptional regulator, Crp/Fnr family [hydrothermal vent metagenome]|uniref:Transcriptional regulator, Crp/Fnr family n=1 Tax=hydrothermal vent metagenome TaxID=652676 RepID=A0A3B0UTE7_9ZZZZ
MSDIDIIRKSFAYLGTETIDQLLETGIIQTIPKGTKILREGQYVKVVPLVIEGLIKVYTKQDDKELLLYYIQPKESCIMSFSSSLSNDPSKVYAVTESETKALLLPATEMNKWIKQFPNLNNLFFGMFKLRYADLLDTINHIIFNKLDQRILFYLKDKSELTNSKVIHITHKQIASELGTAREVVSRILKKLEKEGLVMQLQEGVKLL